MRPRRRGGPGPLLGWALVAVLAAALLLAGCAATRYGIPGRDIVMELAVEPAPGSVTVTVTGNLPRGSRLHVALLRPYRHAGDPATRYGTAGAAVVELTNGQAEPVELAVDDRRWYDDVRDRALAGADPPLVAVEDRLRVLVLFTPHLEQDPEIYRLLGDDFRHLRGAPQLASGAGEAGSAWYLEIEAWVLQGFPLERQVAP